MSANEIIEKFASKSARAQKELYGAALIELRARIERDRQAAPGGLMNFVKYFWHVLEPNREFIEGWALEAMAEHLEAVSYGRITRLLINISPGPMRDDSLVETARGPVLLRDIRVGDLVLTHKGRYRPVSAVHHQGVLPILRITTQSGRVTHAAPSHPYLAAPSHPYLAAPSHPYLTPFGWVDAGDLRIGDVLAVVNRLEDRPGAAALREEEARLLGYLVGDGSLTQAAPGFTNADPEVIEDFERCAVALGFRTTKIFRKTHWRVRLKGGVLVKDWLLGHDILGASSYTKRIPARVMSADWRALAAFVGAYWTCDGVFDIRPFRLRGSCYRAYGTPVNLGLAEDLIQALGLLGIEAKLRKHVRKLEAKTQPGVMNVPYGVEIQGETMVARFADLPGLCSRKRGLARQCPTALPQTLWDDEIVSIEQEEPSNCMCLTVDVDHSFVCSGIAVKNSMKSLMVNVFWPAWEWSVINPGLRYISFSYSSLLTERDNQRFLDLLESKEYIGLYGNKFTLRAKGVTKVSNDQHGWKFASSVRGTGTGERGDRVLCDDPHSVREGESQVVREETVRWFKETMSNRLNHMTKSAVVIVMQRVNSADISGTIIEEGQPYDHLMIPLFYEPGRSYPTSIGWLDPRTVEGENYWPERVPQEAVDEILRMGPFAVAAQYQQRPEPRGGGIFRREWWNIWDPEDGKYPPFDYILASCDPAYTKDQGNDPTGLIVLGVNYADNGTPRVFLVAAWRKHLSLHGPDIVRELGEDPRAFLERQKAEWGLVEWITHTCRRFRVDRLLVEAKASGISVVQELERLMLDREFGIEFVNPGRADKTVRANRVQHLFSSGMIYRPDREWAVMVEDEMAAFNPVKKTSKYDDLTDCVCQALWYLRNRRYLDRKEEIIASNAITVGLPNDGASLYPI
jgi:hypothetical protein